MAAGLIVAGLGALMSQIHVATHAQVACGCLIALAIGVRLPHELAVWITRLPRRKSGRRGVAPPLVDWSSPDERDRPFHWMVLAVVTLLAGLVTCGLLVAVRVAGGAHAWLDVRFLWSPGGRVALGVALALVVGLVPMTALGLALSCAHRIGRDGRGWSPVLTAWFMLGAGAGVMFASAVVEVAGRADVLLLAAPIPILLSALYCVRGAGSARNWWGAAGRSRPGHCVAAGRRRPAHSCGAGPLPLLRDHWPGLIRGACVAAGGCAGWIAVSWLTVSGHGGPGHFGHGAPGHFGHGAPGHSGYSATALAVWSSGVLMFAGAGFLMGVLDRRRVVRSVGGFGVACAAAGLLGGLAMSVHVHSRPLLGSWSWLFPLVGVGAGAYATSYGLMVIFNRVAGRTRAGVRLLSRVMICAALMSVLGGPAVDWLGASAGLALGPIGLVAIGGVAILHEPRYSNKTRRARVAGVFVATALIICLIPPSGTALGSARSAEPAPVPDAPSTATAHADARSARECAGPAGSRSQAPSCVAR